MLETIRSAAAAIDSRSCLFNRPPSSDRSSSDRMGKKKPLENQRL
ncbi:hypothetical protein [Azospirillum melinis]